MREPEDFEEDREVHSGMVAGVWFIVFTVAVVGALVLWVLS